jgi:hypothetical protein
MKKLTVIVSYWYTISADGTRGSLAVDHPIGLISLNEYSERFSDPNNGITVQYAAINRGFSVSGSQNGRPLSEDALRYYAQLCINLINGAAPEMVIKWRSHNFLAARRTGERRGNPRFGPSQTQKSVPLVSYMSTLARELATVSTTD